MKNLSEFTTEELSVLSGEYHTLIGQIESWLYHPDRREFLDYLCKDPDYGASDFDSIADIDMYDITINMEEDGCRCCGPHASFQRTFPLTYITEDGWKDKLKGLAAEKAAEEKKKRLEKKRKAAEAKKRKEEKDLSEYKRLQEKFDNKA